MSEKVETKNDAADIVVGMTKDAALAYLAGLKIAARIVVEDDQTFMTTMDYNVDRINLEVKSDKVVAFSRG
jgi:hypothetical protein